MLKPQTDVQTSVYQHEIQDIGVFVLTGKRSKEAGREENERRTLSINARWEFMLRLLCSASASILVPAFLWLEHVYLDWSACKYSILVRVFLE